MIALLMKVSNAASNAQNLQQFIAEQIGALRLDDDDILTPYVGSLVSLVEKGHKEAFGALKKCKKFFDANSKELEENLDKLLDVVGFDELGDKIQEIMDIDVKKLFNSVPALCKQLGQTVVKHKMVILGVLLAIALVSAAVLVPFIAPIGMACLSNPEIFIALFKVLSVVGKYSDDAARAALQIFAQIARSNAELEGHIQRALLDAVNIVKDKSQYCNIFKPETMQAFEKLSRANPEAYANIVAWNTGKKARIGDTKKYLMKAGETPTKASGAAAAINGVGLLALFSGSKEKKKKNLVSPSPQSQSMHVSTEVQQNLHINVPPTPSVSTPGVFAVLPPTPDTRGSVRIERDLFGANPGTSLPAMTASGKQESLAEFMVRQKWEKEMGILPKQTSTAISTASTASSTTQGNPTGSFKSAVDIMAPINYTPYSPLDESILPPQSVRAQVINDGVSHLLSTVPEETEVSVVGKESHMVAAESTAAKFTPVKSKGILLSWFFSSSKKKVGVAAQQKVSKNTLSQPSAEYKPGYKIVQSSSGINTVVLASGKHSLRPTNNVASYNNTNTNASSDWASSPISSNQLSNGTFAPPTPEDEIRALRQRLAMLEAQRGQPPGHQ
ncbi:hypothetical protein EON65_01195 [archaeon]|nr:MAG: hypothetical protein EON65_01195 [archaeon]